MPRGPNGERRPADVVGCAVTVAKIATGEIEEDLPEHLAPALTATAEDVEAYNRDLEENGTLTLEQIKREYGLE